MMTDAAHNRTHGGNWVHPVWCRCQKCVPASMSHRAAQHNSSGAIKSCEEQSQSEHTDSVVLNIHHSEDHTEADTTATSCLSEAETRSPSSRSSASHTKDEEDIGVSSETAVTSKDFSTGVTSIDEESVMSANDLVGQKGNSACHPNKTSICNDLTWGRSYKSITNYEQYSHRKFHTKNRNESPFSDSEPLLKERKQEQGTGSECEHDIQSYCSSSTYSERKPESEDADSERYGNLKTKDRLRGDKVLLTGQDSAGRKTLKSKQFSKEDPNTLICKGGPKRGMKDRKDQKKMKGKQKADKNEKNFDLLDTRAAYPTSVYFILGSEFCERFTHYGLRTILVLYLISWLNLAQNQATAVYHLFNFLSFAFPILGAIIADGFLGRYRTILYLSFIYALGCITLSITALPPPELVGPLVGLVLISLGTGGIKPCVVAFGGDQFPRKKLRQRASFFSSFYLIINIGGLLSTFITPVLRSDVHCVDNSCYPLAFGVPAILMIFALVVFFAGRRRYKKVRPMGSLFSKTVKCICHALRASNKAKGYRDNRQSHWLDAASDVYEKDFIEDVKMLTRLVWLFLPLPMFWALYNQQGSRWTLQAAQLDGSFTLFDRLKPDQMQALNPLLIILLIPVFEKVIYPCLASCSVATRLLQRMTAGMAFTAVAFFLAAMLQMKIDRPKEEPLREGMSGYTILNTIDCKINVHGEPSPFFEGNVAPFGMTSYRRIRSGIKYITAVCPSTGLQELAVVNLTRQSSARVVVVSQRDGMRVFQFDDEREKSTNGTGIVSFLLLLAWVDTAQIKISSMHDEVQPVIMQISLQNATHFHIFEPGSYQIALPSFAVGRAGQWEEVGKPFEVGSGGVYTVALIDPNNGYDLAGIVVERYVNVKANSLSMMMMIPQYIFLTIGEILFSVSGLNFVYTQAPDTMKSVIQAIWLFASSVGDLIVVFVAEFELVSDQMSEFLLFAILMAIDAFVFAVMACFYTDLEQQDLPNKEKRPFTTRKKRWSGRRKKCKRKNSTRRRGKAQ